MASKLSRSSSRQRRHQRVRRKIRGSAERPRMAVCLSGKHIYVQFVDDLAGPSGHTLAQVSTLSPEAREQQIKPNMDGAEALGRLAAEKAKAVGISTVVFDRGGFRFRHGRVERLANGARAAGLQF